MHEWAPILLQFSCSGPQSLSNLSQFHDGVEIVCWDQIYRVLCPGGTYFAQHVGHRSGFELSEFFLGPQPDNMDRDPDMTRAEAQAAGLEVVDLKFERTKMEFFDVGAVIHFLRKVVWLMPDFSVEKYADKLKEMHEYIQTHQSFVAYSSRFLIVARKPATPGSL